MEPDLLLVGAILHQRELLADPPASVEPAPCFIPASFGPAATGGKTFRPDPNRPDPRQSVAPRMMYR